MSLVYLLNALYNSMTIPRSQGWNYNFSALYGGLRIQEAMLHLRCFCRLCTLPLCSALTNDLSARGKSDLRNLLLVTNIAYCLLNATDALLHLGSLGDLPQRIPSLEFARAERA